MWPLCRRDGLLSELPKSGGLLTEKYVSKPQFDEVWPSKDGVAAVNRGNLYGYIDSEGKSIYYWVTARIA